MATLSTGTVQNAIRCAESLGYFESKQCVGTTIHDKSLNIAPCDKMFSKKDSAVLEIKKTIVSYKINTPLPSIRNLAAKIGASHNTTRLALDTLTQAGYLEKKFAKGNEIKWFVVKNEIGEYEKSLSAKSQTLSQKLEEKIQNYITENYKTGDKILSNEEFALYFNVSIKTINDAMKNLNKKGIILSRRGYYGTIYVSNPNNPQIRTEKGEKSIFMTSPIKKEREKFLYNWEKALGEVKKYIIKNYETGDKIPSMKELGNILKVSPNTIRKAVNILCAEDILHTQRGKYGGIYINSMPDTEETYAWLALNPEYKGWGKK